MDVASPKPTHGRTRAEAQKMKDLAQAAEAQKTLESKIIVVKSGPTGGHWRVEGMTAHMEKGKPVFFASACQKVPVSIRNFFCYLCQCL